MSCDNGNKCGIRKYLYHKCVCHWKEECRNIQKMFKHDDEVELYDPRKGDYFRLNLKGENLKNKAWRSSVLKSLCINPKLIKDLKNAHMECHHWSVKQLQNLLKPRKAFPSSPMSYSDVKKIAHFVENMHTINKSNLNMCFNAPNYHMHLIRTDVKAMHK